MKFALYFFLAAIPLVSQPLRVYSEFVQIDSKGGAVTPSRPREILSPLAVRNGFTSLQIVVRVSTGQPFLLQVGQNPEGSFGVTLYREAGDRLDSVGLPYRGNSTEVFWMDLWVPQSTPVGRIKVEPQLEVDDNWWVHPMEMRVAHAIAKDPETKQLQATGTPLEVMKSFVCGFRLKFDPSSVDKLSMAWFHLRNARQDLMLATVAADPDRAGYLARPRMEQLRTLLGNCDPSTSATDPEAYLRVRDFLLGLPF